MIFREFVSNETGRHSYLIGSCETRDASIINPVKEMLDRYLVAIQDLEVRLECTLETGHSASRREGALVLRERLGSRRVAPAQTSLHRVDPRAVVDAEARPNGHFSLGDMRVDFVTPPDGDASAISYAVENYEFVDEAVLINEDHSATASDELREPGLDHIQEAASGMATTSAWSARGVVGNPRASDDGVSIERRILEDLHASISEAHFTPKEVRVVHSYVRLMEDNEFAHPSADQLAAAVGNIDRTAIHVLVHNIRWKQIDRGRMPLVLAGQTSKWLKGLKTKPEFTSHEKEFLDAYFRLLGREGEPPSGPSIAKELGADRSVQWVRKRAHTIRRKQREFGQPVLVLSRKSSDSGEETPRAGDDAELKLSRSA